MNERKKEKERKREKKKEKERRDVVFLLQLPWCVKEQLPLRLRFFCFALKNSFRCVWRSKSEVGFRRLWEFGEGQQF